MKNKYFQSALVIAMFLCTACSWLDVHPVEEVDKKTMYATTDGFYNVLNGVYLSLGEAQLYGENLSWGSMEAWGRGYHLDKTMSSHQKLYSLMECKYDSRDIMALSETIWKKAYLNIARLNDFIQEADSKPADFFQHGLVEKNLLVGEAKGLRAMLHFDLYRIFGQSPLHPTEAEKAYVPYVSSYPSKSNPPTPVAEFFEALNEDLKQAAELVGTYDNTEEHAFAVLSNLTRFSPDEPGWGRFYSQRGVRLNYFAIRVLQARVALYQRDYEAAITYASEIVKLSDQKDLKFVSTGNIKTHPKMMDEVLFAFYNELLKDAAQNKFDYKQSSCLKVEDYALFKKVSGDRRSDMIYNQVLTIYTVDEKEQYIPAIRFSEAYYILAEAFVHTGQLDKAVILFNDFRKKRGVYSASAKVPDDVTSEVFMDLLIEDARREFAGLGQNVFIYKRLNLPVAFSGGTFMESQGNLKLNIPQSESGI